MSHNLQYLMKEMIRIPERKFDFDLQRDFDFSLTLCLFWCEKSTFKKSEIFFQLKKKKKSIISPIFPLLSDFFFFRRFIFEYHC
mgnify:CR=1 FL=1